MVVTGLPTTLETWVKQERTALACDHDGAGAAQAHATTVLGAVQVERVAEHP